MMPKPRDQFAVIATFVRPAEAGDVVMFDDGTAHVVNRVEYKFWAKIPGLEHLVLCYYSDSIPRSVAAFEAVKLLRVKFPQLFEKHGAIK